MPNVRIRLRRLGPLALVALAILVGGCTPQAVTAQGSQIQSLYDLTFAVGAIIFFFVEGLIVFAVLRYRRKPGQTELPVQTHGNNLLEIVWTVIPLIIVTILFFLSWNTLNSVDATNTNNIRIRADAQRFQWSFDYLSADGNTVLFHQVAPEMVVPAGETVHLTLRSADVNHSFYVPQFLFKRDVIPGVENNFDFTVDAADAGQTFRGQCAQLCGTFHDTMLFSVVAMTPADYQAWLQKQIASAPPTASPGASGSAAPNGGPGASASGAPAPSGSAGGSGSATTLDIAAQNISFDKSTLTAPANTPFTIQFTNNDAGIPHDVQIHNGPNQSDPPIFEGEIFNGVGTKDYQVPALKPGTYAFSCKVHPSMTGTLTVQ